MHFATKHGRSKNVWQAQQSISEPCKGKTLLVIAGGKIAEQGTHAQLVGKNGIYKNFIAARENSQDWRHVRVRVFMF